MGARAVLALLPLLCAPRGAALEVPAWIELVPERVEVFVHEPVRLALRLWIEESFFAEHLVQPFLRPLEIPAEVHTAGLAELAGAELLAADEAPEVRGPRFALDGAPARAQGLPVLVREGRRHRGWEHRLLLVPTRPGALELPAPRLRLVHASGFREDFLGGRVPIDRHEDLIVGAPGLLDVRPLPGEGRPATFSGGVGRFEVAAHLSRSRVALGESVRLELRIAGEGQLARIAPPRLDELEGFHLFGMLDELAPGERRLVYDLAPRSVAQRSVPPIELWTFDPSPPGSYRRLATAPLELEVTPGPGGELALDGLASGPTPSDAPPETDPGSDRSTSSPLVRLAALLALVALIALGALVLRSRRRAGLRPVGAAPSPTRTAGAHDPEGRLAERLGALLGVPGAALVDAALEERLVRAGVGHAAAARAARLFEELVAVRYGGPAAERPEERVELLLAELPPIPGPQPVAPGR